MNTNFPLEVKHSFANLKYPVYLKKHQYIPQKYLENNENSRGLMIFHGMGKGKTRLAVGVSEYYANTDTTRKIIVLASKSLHQNFRDTVKQYRESVYKTGGSAGSPAEKWLKDDVFEYAHNFGDNSFEFPDLDTCGGNMPEYASISDETINQKYKFISMNASNMFTQVSNFDKTKQESQFEKEMGEISNMLAKKDFLENTLLIVDEFQNLSNAITNGSMNAVSLYDAIMETRNIKIIFLSGTPVINKPFELVCIFNMLSGKIRYKGSNLNLFTESQDEFDDYFVDYKKRAVKNKDKFQNRILGFVSYFGDMVETPDKNDFPEKKALKVEIINMSASQFGQYDFMRSIEKAESYSAMKNQAGGRFAGKGSASSSYRVRSRQKSNFYIPEYALGPRIGKKARQKRLDLLKPDVFQQLSTYSPKFEAMLKNIKKHDTGYGVGLVYSEFVSGEGLNLFGTALESIGYQKWTPDTKGHASADLSGGAKSPKKLNSPKSPNKFNSPKSPKLNAPKYAILSGQVPIEERNKLIETIKRSENVKGELINIILISKTGAEGLDLKYITHLHIMEPFWNYARIEQVIFRAVRYKSHQDLPKSHRVVNPYIYLSTYPKSYKPKKTDLNEPTTDVLIFKQAISQKKLINAFLQALVEASIDCTVHAKKSIQCKMCAPTNQPLYHPILHKDMLMDNPCKPMKQNKITVKELSLAGVDDKIYYSRDGDNISIFQYDTSINGYKPMELNDPVYAIAIKKILFKK
jgi:hypothetical protein